MTDVIVVEGLTRRFGALAAVDDVSFAVAQGEIFGFLGPNGAGKTTTINVLCTLLRPTSGRVHVAGHDVVRHRDQVRRSIGLVFQEPALDLKLTAEENVYLHARLYGVPADDYRRRLAEVLQLVELWDRRHDRVETYSGGMKRRLEIARGLVHYPRVLFLDEPTLGLDVQTRAAVWKYIRMLKEQFHMTLFLTTHYLEEADSLCDRIAIIDHGHIIRIGSPTDLKESIGGDVIVVGVADGEPDISADILRIPLVREAKKQGSEYRIKAEQGEETTPQIMDLIRSKGLHVTKISLTKPTLDEAYLEFTGKSIREEEANQQQMFSQRVTMRRARS